MGKIANTDNNQNVVSLRLRNKRNEAQILLDKDKDIKFYVDKKEFASIGNILDSISNIESEYAAMNGSNYLMVYGIGTPEENAAELQAAYDTAKNMPRYLAGVSHTFLSKTFYKGQTLFNIDTMEYRKLFADVTTTSSEILDDNSVEITELEAKSTRTTIIVAPGEYEFSATFTHDSYGIDIVSLTGNADVKINGISVTTSYTYIKGLNCMSYAFSVLGSLADLVCENCIGGDDSFKTVEEEAELCGTYINCVGGQKCWNAVVGATNCKCIDCVGGEYSFGFESVSETISGGYYERCGCTGGKAFGVGGISAGVILKDCYLLDTDADTLSFSAGADMNGILIGCRLYGADVWSQYPVATTGHQTYCINGDGTAATNV